VPDVNSIKLTLSVVAAVVIAAGFYPYYRDILRKKTQPHLYTWLIWLITQATATVGVWKGGGGYQMFSYLAGLVLVIGVFLLTLKYGTKNITRTDTALLGLALLAIVGWWQLNSLLLAVFAVSAIDALGYLPTLRKCYHEPWSETLSFWVLMICGNAFSMLSSAHYNALTLTYSATISIGNAIVCLLCLWRRKTVPVRSS